MSRSNIDTDHVEGWDAKKEDLSLSNAWKAKYEQAYQKAKVCFPGDPLFESLNSEYSQKIRFQNSKKKIFHWGLAIVLGIFLIFLIGFYAVIGKSVFTSDSSVTEENARLEAIRDEAYAAIDNGDYSKARSLISQLNINTSKVTAAGIAESAQNNWNEIKAELNATIEQNERNQYQSNVSYANIINNPNLYLGTKIKLEGEVVKQLTDIGGYERWLLEFDNNKLVFRFDKDILDSELKEEDNITLYGIFIGNNIDIDIFNSDSSVTPDVYAEKIDIDKPTAK